MSIINHKTKELIIPLSPTSSPTRTSSIDYPPNPNCIGCKHYRYLNNQTKWLACHYAIDTNELRSTYSFPCPHKACFTTKEEKEAHIRHLREQYL